MPRHFLVKRHKNCTGTISYRDRLYEGQEGSDIRSYTTTTLETDKYSIIRDGDYISDYSGYGSPDSGYAASPNSSHIGFARDKENLATDRENNNNKNCNKTSCVINYYDMTTATGMSTIDGSNYCSSSDNIQYEMETDIPMDLSMPSRKKTVLSSVPAYLQRDESHHSKSQQQQQQEQLYHCKPSPNDSLTTLLTTAAIKRLDSFNKLYLNNNNERSICLMMPPLSPTNPAYNTANSRHLSVSSLFSGTLKTDVSLDSESVAHTEILSRAQCITVPSVSNNQRPSSPISSSSSPPPASSTLEIIRVTPLNSPTPLQSPNRKRGISDDNEICSEFYPQDLSKSLPALKKSDIKESNTTPMSKATSAQKARTTAPAMKKSPGSVPCNKKMKAVRRLNFDIDTTSPVSGTIIKDAADFHPEDGKVVYGDIEPSFNFVEVTPEARAELEKIENKIGDYICQLCKEFYEDAFQLAQHRCSRIIHVEYRCPECEKVFNCPANLASHRRWHKPRVHAQNKSTNNASSKILPISQKISPKPDCNGNMTEPVLGMTLKRDAPPNICVMTTDNSLTTNGYDVITSDIKRPESGSYNDTCIVNTPRSGNGSPVFSGVDDVSKLSYTESKGNSVSSIVSVTQPLTLTSSREEMARPVTTTSFPYISTSAQDSYIRPDTVIAVNPLRTTPVTYGSNLTSEERSLVFQVLNSHNRQHQTTAITSTTNTYHISDTRGSTANFINETCDDELERNDTESLKCSSMSQDASDNLNFSSSPPPVDLVQVKDTHRYHQHQNQQGQTALSEHQFNPQIGCSICGKKFQRQAYLRKHILSQHGKQYDSVKTEANADGDQKATDNSIIYGNQSSADRHDHISNTTDFSCSVCGKFFTSESARYKHESLTHGFTTVLACNTCNMTFTSKASLDKHSRYAHATETYSCKYCSSTFHSSPGLTRHINKCHPTENRRVILLQLPAARTY